MSTTEEAAPKAEGLDEELEKIAPSKKTASWTVGTGDVALHFVQRPLSYFGKLELLSLLGRALDKAMSDGMSIAGLLSPPEGTLETLEKIGELTPEERSKMMGDESDAFVHAVAKIIMYAPELIQDIYCVILGVPRGQREMAKALMERPKDEGGFDDDEGFEIMALFFEQNGMLLRDFFGARIRPLVERASRGLGLAESDTPSPMPSSPTPPPTPSE